MARSLSTPGYTVLSVLLATTLPSGLTGQATDTTERGRLTVCSRMPDDAARLSCYDTLARELLPQRPLSGPTTAPGGGVSDRIAQLSAEAERRPRAILATLTNKTLHKGEYQEFMTFEFTFMSYLQKPVRAFTGTLTFLDLFDRAIYTTSVTVEEPVEYAKTVDWFGSVEFNQFLEEHQRLRSISRENLRVRFDLEAVVYSDGTREVFGAR